MIEIEIKLSRPVSVCYDFLKIEGSSLFRMDLLQWNRIAAVFMKLKSSLSKSYPERNFSLTKVRT